MILKSRIGTPAACTLFEKGADSAAGVDGAWFISTPQNCLYVTSKKE